MLAKDSRLRKNSDFERVFTKGRKLYATSLGLRFAQRNDSKASRFGFMVSTKVSKDSVIRNRLRRRFREIVKAHNKNILPGYDVVVVAFPESTKLDFGEIKNQLEHLLVKASLIKV